MKAAGNLPQGGGLRKLQGQAQLGPVADMKPPKSAGKTDPRNARLAAQLRANLQRRKAQARARAEPAESAEEAPTQPPAPEVHIGRRLR